MIIIKNDSGGDVLLDDIGIVIEDASQKTVLLEQISDSTDLHNNVNAGTLVINNGADDLSIADALKHINIQTEFEDAPEDAVFDGTVTVFDVYIKETPGFGYPPGFPVFLLPGASGVSGDQVRSTFALANNIWFPCHGLAVGTIAPNADGYIRTFGRLDGIDTSGFGKGEALYVDGGSGGLINTKPVGDGYEAQEVATVLSVDATDGAVFIHGCGGGLQFTQAAIEANLAGDVTTHTHDHDHTTSELITYSLYDQVGGQHLDDTARSIHFDTTRLDHSDFTAYDDAGGTSVIVNTTGIFLVSYYISIGAFDGQQQSVSESYLEIDTGSGFNPIPGSEGYMYHRIAGEGESNAAVTFPMSITSGDVIRLIGKREIGTSDLTTEHESLGLSFVCLSNVTGFKGEDGANGAQGPVGTTGQMNHEFVEMSTAQTTTSATFIDVPNTDITLTLDGDSPIVGILSFEAQTTGAGTDATGEFGISIDGTDYGSGHMRYFSGTNDIGIGAVTVKTDSTFAAGDYVIKMRFRRVAGDKTVQVNDAHLLALAMLGPIGPPGADGTDGEGLGTHEATFDHSDMTTNADDIATAFTDITTNTDDIAQAFTDITTNTDDIASAMTDITTNTDDIASAMTDITTNTDDIATAFTDITTNADGIATAMTDITTNADDIAQAFTDITTNTDDITQLFTDTTSNADDITQLFTDTTSNADDIAILQGHVDLKTIIIESPVNGEDLTFFFTPNAITISEMRAVVRGTSPDVTWTLRHALTRDAAGAEVVTGGTQTTSQTSGSDVTSFNDADIPADSFIWVETTAKSGTIDELSITAVYTQD